MIYFIFEEVFKHESIYFKDFKSRFFDIYAQILSDYVFKSNNRYIARGTSKKTDSKIK